MESNSIKLHFYFHCYAKGSWLSIAESLLMPFQGQKIECTLVGSLIEHKQLKALFEKLNIIATISRFTNPEIFEHEVMRILSSNAKRNLNDYTLYFHTKGVGNVSRKGRRWRELMIENFLINWKDYFVRLKSSDKDACGLWYGYWEKDPELAQIHTRFFAGNFWMAKNSYIAKLPQYQRLLDRYPTRFLAERYIGWADPEVMYLNQDNIMPISGKNSVQTSLSKARNSKSWYQILLKKMKNWVNTNVLRYKR